MFDEGGLAFEGLEPVFELTVEELAFCVGGAIAFDGLLEVLEPVGGVRLLAEREEFFDEPSFEGGHGDLVNSKVDYCWSTS